MHTITARVTDSWGLEAWSSIPIRITALTPPAVAINQAVSQPDPADAAPVHFTAVFSAPVTGFTSADVILSGTAHAATVVVTETAPHDGTTYDVAVSGMTSAGTVIAAIRAGAAQDAAGSWSGASTSADHTVTYTSIVLRLFLPFIKY
jgi:hypothetical protein